MDKNINRIMKDLVGNGKTNKWHAVLEKDSATTSKCCTNAAQPNLDADI